jgi:hypothetical protein
MTTMTEAWDVADIRYAQSDRPPHERTETMPIGIPPRTLGWGVIHWGAKYLRQPDGPHAGERFKIVDSQARWLLWWYSLDPLARFIYSHGVRRLPKGSGKSPFAAFVALAELVGPVRFDYWDDDVEGGAVGKPVGMPLVQIGATAESQAAINTMRMVRAFVPPGSKLVSDFQIDAGKTIMYTPGGGQLSLITNSAQASEGALTTFAILDQTELFTTANGGVELAQTVDRNVGKQKNRIVETSNAWKPGKDSYAETTAKAWYKEQEGGTRGRARTLMDVRMAPPSTLTYKDKEQRDPDIPLMIEGVREAYGDCHWADPEDIVEVHVLDAKMPLDVSKRFYFNWPTSAQDTWVEWQWWSNGTDLEFVLEEDEDITLGFDGSRVNDSTALIGCHVPSGYTFTVDIWETINEAGKKVPIPVKEVDAAVERAFARWNVCGFFADVKEWEGFSKVTWPERYADQLLECGVWARVGGEDPQPIAWDMRSHVSHFTAAAEMVAQEIENNDFKHDGDTRLARHVVNARRSPNKWGVSISKETPDSPDKIDGAVAMVIARHVRRLVLASENYGRLAKAKAKKRSGQVWSWS